MSSKWTCEVCTLENGSRRRRCLACEARRPVEGGVAKKKSSQETAVTAESASPNSSTVTSNNTTNEGTTSATEQAKSLVDDCIATDQEMEGNATIQTKPSQIEAWLKRRRRKRRRSDSEKQITVRIILDDNDDSGTFDGLDFSQQPLQAVIPPGGTQLYNNTHHDTADDKQKIGSDTTTQQERNTLPASKSEIEATIYESFSSQQSKIHKTPLPPPVKHDDNQELHHGETDIMREVPTFGSRKSITSPHCSQFETTANTSEDSKAANFDGNMQHEDVQVDWTINARAKESPATQNSAADAVATVQNLSTDVESTTIDLGHESCAPLQASSPSVLDAATAGSGQSPASLSAAQVFSSDCEQSPIFDTQRSCGRSPLLENHSETKSENKQTIDTLPDSSNCGESIIGVTSTLNVDSVSQTPITPAANRESCGMSANYKTTPKESENSTPIITTECHDVAEFHLCLAALSEQEDDAQVPHQNDTHCGNDRGALTSVGAKYMAPCSKSTNEALCEAPESLQQNQVSTGCEVDTGNTNPEDSIGEGDAKDWSQDLEDEEAECQNTFMYTPPSQTSQEETWQQEEQRATHPLAQDGKPVAYDSCGEERSTIISHTSSTDESGGPQFGDGSAPQRTLPQVERSPAFVNAPHERNMNQGAEAAGATPHADTTPNQVRCPKSETAEKPALKTRTANADTSEIEVKIGCNTQVAVHFESGAAQVLPDMGPRGMLESPMTTNTQTAVGSDRAQTSHETTTITHPESTSTREEAISQISQPATSSVAMQDTSLDYNQRQTPPQERPSLEAVETNMSQPCDYDNNKARERQYAWSPTKEQIELKQLPVSSTAGFQTAGKSKSIIVSEAALKQAGSILSRLALQQNHGATQPKRPLPFMCGFHTAGKSKSIAVSEVALHKASSILSRPTFQQNHEALQTQQPLPFTGGFQTAGKSKSITISEEALKNAGSILNKSTSQKNFGMPSQPKQLSSFTGGFQTAGKSKSIAVSEEALKKAGSILSRSNLQQNQGVTHQPKRPQSFSGGFRTAGKSKGITVSEDALKTAGSILSRPASQRQSGSSHQPMQPSSFSGGFQTAGKPKNIAVSGKALHTAESILSRPNLQQNQSKQPSSFSGCFQTAGMSKSIAVSEEALNKAGSILSRPNQQPNQSKQPQSFTGGFQTAGKSKSIAVSEEALNKAGSILSKAMSQQSHEVPHQTKQPQSFTGGFQTAGKSKSIAVSEEALNKAGSILSKPALQQQHGSSKQPKHFVSTFTGGFQTAGNSKSIAVSKEALQQAGSIFSRPTPQQGCGALHNSKQPLSFSGDFQAAGKSKSIAVSEEALCDGASHQAKQPLSSFTGGFQTAGKSKSIDVSEYALQKAGSVLETTLSSHHQNNFTQQPPHNESAEEFPPSRQSWLPHKRALPALSSAESRGRKTAKVTDFETQNGDAFQAGLLARSDEGSIFPREPGTKTSSPNALNLQKDDGIGMAKNLASVDTGTKTPSHASVRMSVVTMSAGIRKQASWEEPLENGRTTTPCEVFSPVPIHFGGDQVEREEEGIGFEEPLGRATKPPTTTSLMTSDQEQCRKHGVAEITLEVNATNAANLVFDGQNRLPHSFCDQSTQMPNLVGYPNDLHETMVERGCKKEYVGSKWLLNHKRWIVWKLAALGRRFPSVHGGNLLSYEVLLQHLHHRYRKEYEEGKRPALRKILNKDMSPARMMVLCVCQIFRQMQLSDKERTNSGKSGEKTSQRDANFSMELTDGWYSVHVAPDHKICEFVESGKIKVGTKLMVAGAALIGADDGIDPLDDINTPYLKQCKVFLRISANSTRIAKWDTKLGFVAPSQQIRADNGLYRVKRVSDIVPGGGFVPLINLIVCRRYPLMFLHRRGSGEEEMITEAEEHKQRVDFERHKLNLIEKFTEEVEQECTQDVDEMAPPLWIQLTTSSSPEDFYHALNDEGKSVIERWKAKRSAMLQTRIQQEVHARIEDEASLVRDSTAFLRLLVTSHDRSLLDRSEGKKDCKEEAILTVWSPTEEQLSLFREGALVRVENLGARHKYEGRMQLSANGRTNITQCPSTSILWDVMSLSYSQRNFTSLFKIHVSSRRQLQRRSKADDDAKTFIDCDIVGVLLRVLENESEDMMSIYLTDKSNLVVRVQCGNIRGLGDSIGLRSPSARLCVEHPRIIAFRDLTTLPFDDVENCAVLEFRGISSIRTQNSEAELKLRQWTESSAGRSRLLRHAACLDAGLFTLQRPRATFIPLVGYLAGFKVEKSHHLRVLVDCASGTLQEFAFPFHLLQDVVLPNSSRESVALNSVEEGLCSKLTMLGKFYRARGVLHRFVLKKTPQSITSFRPCEYEVCQINAVDMEALCGVYGSP